MWYAADVSTVDTEQPKEKLNPGSRALVGAMGAALLGAAAKSVFDIDGPARLLAVAAMAVIGGILAYGAAADKNPLSNAHVIKPTISIFISW
jgi:uncharacterized membrane protein